MMPDQWQVVYGAGDGKTWYVLRGVYGHLPPQELNELPLLGDTTEVLRSVLHFRMRAAKRTAESTMEMAQRVHDTLARELGVPPATLTDYINDMAIPDLSSHGWGELAKSVYFTRSG